MELKPDSNTDISISVYDEKKINNIILPEYKPKENIEKKSGWNSDIEEYIGKISDVCMKYKRRHVEKASKYLSRYNGIMYSSILLSPLVGMLSAININIRDNTIIPIIILCISFLNGILISIIKFRKWDEGALSHKASAAKYSALASSARRQLNLPHKDREDSDDFMIWFSNAFNKLFLSSPIIGIDSEKEFEELTKVKKTKDDENQLDGRVNYELKRFLNTVLE
jgi:hypothetical protein